MIGLETGTNGDILLNWKNSGGTQIQQRSQEHLLDV